MAVFCKKGVKNNPTANVDKQSSVETVTYASLRKTLLLRKDNGFLIRKVVETMLVVHKNNNILYYYINL